MSFREKTAWAMAMILSLASLFYFNKIITISTALGETAPPIIPVVVAYIIFIMIASIIIMSIVGGTSAKEADAPADEREKIIIDKAGHWSGYVLAAGVMAGLWHFAWQGDGNLLFHIAFGSLMLSQISEYLFQIAFYRQGI